MKTPRRVVGFALLLSCVALGLGAPPAAADSARVYVIKVNDGDTMQVSARKDGTIDYTVRLIGINTPEGHWDRGTWTGTCMSRAAHNKLERMVENKWVELRAANFAHTGTSNRRIRFVHLLNTAKTDVNAEMLKGSLAVAYPNHVEPSRNAYYNRLAKAAAKAGRGVWRSDACGSGPYQSADVRMFVRSYEAALTGSPSNEVLNQEYVRIENRSSFDLPINGWVLRDSSAFYYFFGDATRLPMGGSTHIGPRATIPANGAITVHTGSVPAGKTNGWTSGNGKNKHYYWQLSVSAWARDRIGTNTNNRYRRDRLPVLGDGAFLYDKATGTNRGRDLRAHTTYPCLSSGAVTCTDGGMGAKIALGVKLPLAGSGDSNAALNASVVSIKNVSLGNVDLSGYMLDSWPQNFEFQRYPATILAPNEVLHVHVGADPGGKLSVLNQYWDAGKQIFWDPDYLELRRMDGAVAKRLYWDNNAEDCDWHTDRQWRCGAYND